MAEIKEVIKQLLGDWDPAKAREELRKWHENECLTELLPITGDTRRTLGKVTYTPPPNFTGNDSFSYTVRSAGSPSLAEIMRKIMAMAQETINTGGRVELNPEEVRSMIAEALGDE